MTIQELAKDYGLTEKDFWHHQQSGQWILTHNAVEIIAYIENIKIQDIKVLNSDENLVRFLITMRNDKGGEVMSIGEADRNNCKSQYIGCMAEKRGIDRCVLKLINAYEYGISSEVEADDFEKKSEVYTITNEQKEKYQELLQSGAYNGDKQKVNKWWKGLNTFEQAESGLIHMEKIVTKYKEKEQHD